MLSRLGKVIDVKNFIQIRDQGSIIFAMAEKSQPQSIQDDEIRNQQPEDLVRQDYHVRVSDGRKFMVPNALEDLDLHLARTNKPNYSMAVNMLGGVSNFLLGPLL